MHHAIPKVICATPKIKELALKELENTCKQCNGCNLAVTRTSVVFADGNPDAKIMLIGEAPGADEDTVGKPFIGKAGQLLNQFLADAGFDRHNDIYICNTVKCRPPQNRVPSNEEKSACKAYLYGQIAIIKPKIILLCGATAAELFIKEDFRVTELRGKWLNIFDNIDTMVIFHPSYLLRNHSFEEGTPRWLMAKDLLNIRRKLIELENESQNE